MLARGTRKSAAAFLTARSQHVVGSRRNLGYCVMAIGHCFRSLLPSALPYILLGDSILVR